MNEGRQASGRGMPLRSVSIHAPREGSDLLLASSSTYFTLFQSTPPVREATATYGAQNHPIPTYRGIHISYKIIDYFLYTFYHPNYLRTSQGISVHFGFANQVNGIFVKSMRSFNRAHANVRDYYAASYAKSMLRNPRRRVLRIEHR